MLEKMRPFQGGGEMIEEVTEENVTYNHPPHRFEAGTPLSFRRLVWVRRLNIWKKIGRHGDPGSRGRLA
ncbi:aminotransferase class V-fold PLP-dependent enzyme [Brucella abortus]|nr:aminotransferase class V-fold PLP-dependent enzyme [Brucella abortus]